MTDIPTAATPGKSNLMSLGECDELIECHEDLKALRRWQASLEHQLRLARLRFEFMGLDPEAQEALSDEVAEFKVVARAYAEARRTA